LKTLLISTVGGQVGHGILKVLEPLRDRLRIIGLNSVAEVSMNFLCDVAYLVPPTADGPAWSARLRAILDAERPDAVIAARDEDLAPLAAVKADPAYAAIAFFSPDDRAAAIVTSKVETARFAAAHGLRFADTAWDAAGVARLLAAHGFPLIVKPQSASGGAGVRAVVRDSEVAAWLERGGVVFQPFIAPQALGEDAVDPALGIPLGFSAPWRSYINPTATVGLDGRAVYRGCSFLEPRPANSTRSGLMADAGIEELTLAYARALAALGFVGTMTLQGRRDGEGLFLPFEICGRVSGGVASRALIGLDELGAVLEFALPDLPPMAPAPTAIVHKVPDWHRLDAAMVERLRADAVWRKLDGPPDTGAG